MEKKAKPVAVLIADVHYNINTLAVADAAMRQAIAKANELDVPFIVAGDLHDTKANIRGECIKAMIETFQQCKTSAYVLVGNHCRINEKGEAHSLEFLRSYATIIDLPSALMAPYPNEIHLLPYYSSPEALQEVLDTLPKGSTIIMHQGVQSAHMGHYVQDKTSLPQEAFADFRVISGHYHRRQDIKCGRPRKGAVGLFSYIGNPYTLNFGEALDPPKGFQVLMDNGILEFHPTNLRKHVVLEMDGLGGAQQTGDINPGDLVWIKIKAPKSLLVTVKKDKLLPPEFGLNFKLDLIPSDSEDLQPIKEHLQDDAIMDKLIDALPDGKEHKTYLKGLWRELVE